MNQENVDYFACDHCSLITEMRCYFSEKYTFSGCKWDEQRKSPYFFSLKQIKTENDKNISRLHLNSHTQTVTK